jgi:tetratricopeptide (TPR) repeat protein
MSVHLISKLTCFKKWISAFKLLITVLTLSFTFLLACQSKVKKQAELFYLNHHDTVDYVGLATCASCHQDKASTFIHTGMGSSFGLALKTKSSASFSNNHFVYDTLNDLYYLPFWKNDLLYIKEFRLNGKDTVHTRTEQINYIIGSGQHTNSHLIERNGFVYQAPLTWYSQKKQWDLPPGFEKGRNSRFTRIINEECMSCHNAMPKMEDGTDFQFKTIGKGIDCERCHGPGELHVNLRLKGKTIKSKEGIDRTIINPSQLSWQLQVDLCQRCHLQGNAVLKEGKSFTDFKAGMKLSDYMDVYMPNYENNEGGMIMASHAQRLQLSQCFIKSNKVNNQLNLTCISCHNPHVSVRETRLAQFNNACKKCHSSNNNCGIKEEVLKRNKHNCVSCHMPKSGADDIPHVTVHDHYIRKPTTKTLVNKGNLKGLYSINNINPSKTSSIKAYLSYYEKFDPNEKYLQEARKLLNTIQNTELEIYYYYLLGDNTLLIKSLKGGNQSKFDAWTNYRIGQTYYNEKEWLKAETYLQKALESQPKNFEFLYKMSLIKHSLKSALEEEQLLKQVIALNPNHTAALNNLGYYYFINNEPERAYSFYKRSLKTNPDYLPVLKNLFDYFIYNNNKIKAKEMANRILKLEPNNKIIKEFIY